MRKAHIPFVLVDRKIEGIDADVVYCDDYEGGKLAAKHLLSLGHKDFLYVQGPAYSSSQADRERGFTDELKKHNVSDAHIHFFPDELLLKEEGGHRLALLLKEKGITSALVFRDEMAYLMINELRQEGIKVPRDLSVIGFDHLHGPFPFLQPLTSIFCKEEFSLGRSAACLLLNRIREPFIKKQEVIFPVKLYHEGTTQKPG